MNQARLVETRVKRGLALALLCLVVPSALASEVWGPRGQRPLVIQNSLAGRRSRAASDEIDEYVKAEMARLDVPGVVYAIVRNGKVVRQEAVGYSDPAAKTPARTDDLFEIGSITKQFTAMCALILIEKGDLRLEDPVSKYLTDLPAAWSGVKIRNLLNQNSGLPEYALVPGIGLLDKFDKAKWLSEMAKVPMDFKPGETWAYSNTNYALLGWVIEKVSGEPYSKFIQEKIFDPLGMTRTSIATPDVTPSALAKGYIRDSGKSVPCPRGGFSIQSDGGMVSCLADMAKWDTALRERRLLKRSSYDLLWKRGVLNDGRARAYGMGWFLNMPGLPEYEGHGGNDAGYSAGISRYPRQGLTVILLCNLYPVGGEVMTKRIAELYDPTVRPAPFKAAADPDAKRTARVRDAVQALGQGKPDESLLDAELLPPLKTSRVKAFGPAPWNAVQKIDAMTFGGSRRQDRDTWLTYRITSGDKAYVALILWTDKQKMVQGTLYTEPLPSSKAAG